MKVKDVELIQKHIKLFGDHAIAHKNAPFYNGFKCPNAWLNVLEKLFDRIEAIVQSENLHDFKIIDIKNKKGALNIYTINANEEIQNLIKTAEYEVDFI